jgi:hypothetical protein
VLVKESKMFLSGIVQFIGWSREMGETAKTHLRPDVHGSVETFVRQELSMLENLFDDAGLTKLRVQTPDHPALNRYDLAEDYLTKRQVLQYPDESHMALNIGNLVLDRLAQTGVEAKQFWEVVGDENTKKEIQARLLDPSQFWIQLSVLNCWSLLRSKGFVAELIEATGSPDILVNKGLKNETWVEVKHIQPTTNPTHVRKTIVKANNQIKRARPDGVGILFLYFERPAQRTVFDDTIPADVEPYLAAVKRELASGFSKSVSQVIVAWDDYMVLGGPPEPTAYFFRRVSKVLEHPSPKARPILASNTLTLGRTVMTMIRWSRLASSKQSLLEPIEFDVTRKAKKIVVTQQFRQESESHDHIRAVHAIAAMRSPDAIERFDVGDETSKIAVILATRRITLGHYPYTLLLFSTERAPDKIEISLGFRLYEEGGDPPNIWLHPLDTFLNLLTRFGAPVQIGSQVELWIPNARVDLKTNDLSRLVEVKIGDRESFILNAIVKINETPKRTADVAWAFAIKADQYRAHLWKYRR